MKKLLTFVFALVFSGVVLAQESAQPVLDRASDIAADASQFSKNLSAVDTDVQKALETLDQLSISSGINWGDIGGTLADQTDLQSELSSPFIKRVVTADDATSITPNTDSAEITYQANTQSAGTLTVNADTGSPVNGRSWLLKIKSTNVQTFSWNAVYIGGNLGLPTATSGSGKIDYFSFIYDAVNGKWHYTGTAGGF